MEAVAKGSTDLAKVLVEHGADINKGSSHVVTPLVAAAATNQLQSCRWLIESGCDMRKLADERPFYTITTPLHFAILHKNVQLAKLLIDNGHDTNYPSNNHNYPLVEAIRCNVPGIVQLIVNERSTDVNNCGRLFGGYTSVPPLHECLFNYRRFEIAEILLATKRCHLTYSGRSYISIMMHKALDPTLIRKLKFLQLVLEAGGDMVNTDNHGNKPFATLIDANDSIFNIAELRSTMELLVRAGIRPSVKDVMDMTKHVKSQEETYFLQQLQEIAETPSTLQENCRTFVRQFFGAYPNDKIKSLPLPEAMINYLTLKSLKQ